MATSEIEVTYKSFILFPARSTPFKVTFVTDSIEVEIVDATIMLTAESLHEGLVAPSGSVGFYLTYTQVACGSP